MNGLALLTVLLAVHCIQGQLLSELIESNHAFSRNLLSKLSNDKNEFLSPYSISEAMSMTYTGARGETEAELRRALQLRTSQRQLPRLLAAYRRSITPRSSNSFSLNVVNGLFPSKNFKINQQYKQIVLSQFKASLRTLDYANTAEAKKTINDWVASNTNNRIKDLIKDLDADTALVLVNAIFFKGDWNVPFDKALTRDRDFNLLDGSVSRVPSMSASSQFNYLKGSNYEAVRLPYKGRKISMTIVLPNQGALADVKANLNLKEIISSSKPEEVMVTMPKFQYRTSYDLVKTFKSLGVQRSFTNLADFSGMLAPESKDNVFIGQIVHDAFVAVDEKGTEAAAATAVVMLTESVRPIPYELNVNRPFLFAIHDDTGAILFVGQVVQPKVEK